ncbi:phosphotransferase enzyme family protein [Patulibacter minatonensis]|uniref:phosphotransferase enzyme family protein n=1 Tax=Patulibacter minatonensis TaxID=298163 RepID=UPI000685B666|nr:phosphotransferase [Patulibacter minatonensis]
MDARRRPWTAEAAAPLVAAAAGRWGLSGVPELLRLGTNASHRVGDAVVRVAPAGREREAVERELALARFLDGRGFDAVRPLDVEQPVDVGGHWATAWVWVPHDPPTVTDGAGFGALIGAFHDVTADYDAPLPGWGALELIAARIGGLHANPHFSAGEIAMLDDVRRGLERRLEELSATTPVGVVHGDAHPGNVLTETGTGRTVLADFDLIGRGPRAWDLAPAALHPRRYGADPAWWDAVRGGYGRPEDESWAVCLRVRELASAAWLFAAEDPSAPARSAEADVRLRAFTGETDPPVWGRH